MNFLRENAPLISFLSKVVDIAIIISMTVVVHRFYGGPAVLMKGMAIYGSIVTIVAFSVFGVYRSWRDRKLIRFLRSFTLVWLLVLVVINVIVLILANQEQRSVLWPYALFKADIFNIWAVYVYGALVLPRILGRFILLSIRRRGYNRRTAVIVGAGQAGLKVGRYITGNPWMGIHLVGYFDDDMMPGSPITLDSQHRVDMLGGVEDVIAYAMKNKVDYLFVALPMKAQEQISTIIWSLGTKGVSIFLVPDLFTLGIQRAKVRFTGDLALMDVNLFPAWKRTFDIFFSMAVVLMTAPLWLLIGILIKIEDAGPILYGHSRVMESGKSFKCWKFRTMHVDADQRLAKLLESSEEMRCEWDQCFKLKNDPRVTAIGRFLRRTSLDELPQFINVLMGQMSVVGARPIVTEELENYYREVALTYCAMKPGITGPWQIGKRSDTVDYQERVELDRRYVLSCTPWLDIKIIFKTIWRVIRPRGAY